ncbi:MAG TPA: GWxTD domain-containing protein [Phaeodactylibacter sp.]|nr:GWxTD domain-containing protein [Phaeodactylibacter sp.]
MKKAPQILATFFLLLSLSAQALDASISYATFKSPQQDYVEIYLYIVGKTVTYVPQADSTTAQAGVEVVILFKKDGTVFKFDKYNLNSPLSSTKESFIDLKRYGLPDGEYELEVSISDNNAPENTTHYQGDFKMDYAENDHQLLQSDIQLLASVKPSEEHHPLVKNGLFLEPLPFNFYHKKFNKLTFYNEVYDTDKKIKNDFLVTYGIEKVVNSKPQTILKGHKKRHPKSVNVLVLQLDISKLESGNYNLFVEIRNRAKELLSRKVIEFQRSNPYLEVSREEVATIDMKNQFVGKLTREELKYSLKAIAPLVDAKDVELLNAMIAKKDSTVQQRFLFNFWVNQNPNQPEVTYAAFMEVAKAVDQLYASGFGHGFESDRGYVYIRYGRPDDVIKVDNDPSAPPYEIWIYNDFPMTKQANVKFLFYAPNLGTDYRILHSTARGELNNPQWQLELYKDVPNEVDGDNYIDATNMQSNWNRHASQYFRDN